MRERWTAVLLRDVAQAVTLTLRPGLQVDLPYVALEHITPGEPRVRSCGRSSDTVSATTLFQAGDVLFSKLRPYLNKVAVAEVEGCCTSEILVWRTKDASVVLPGFLALVLRDGRAVQHAIDMSAGTRMPRTSVAQMNQFSVDLPPLEEQQRIVDLIGSLDEAIEAADAVITDVTNARNAIAEDLISSAPGIRTTLGQVMTIVRGGSPRPIDKFVTDSEEGLNWIKIGDVSPDGRYITSTAVKIRKEGLSKTRAVSKGDFILSNSMSFGRPYILKVDGCIHDGWLSLSDFSQSFSSDFLYYLLRSVSVQAQFEMLAAGSSVRNLKKESVAGVQITVPTLLEQGRIAKILSAADDLLDRSREASDSMRAARSELLSVLLSGAHQIPKSYDEEAFEPIAA